MFNYFFDVLHQDVLIHLSLILMGLKAQSHHDHLSGIEPIWVTSKTLCLII